MKCGVYNVGAHHTGVAANESPGGARNMYLASKRFVHHDLAARNYMYVCFCMTWSSVTVILYFAT